MADPRTMTQGAIGASMGDTGAMSQEQRPDTPTRSRVHPEIPEDVNASGIEKAAGDVTLPLRVQWSGPQRTYDLTDRRDRIRVYEQVLREGTADDVRRFIDVDELLALWDDLYLPAHVRAAWRDWLARHRGARV